MIKILAYLTLLAEISILGLLGLLLIEKHSRAEHVAHPNQLVRQVLQTLRKNALLVGFWVAVFATGASLYMSEVMGLLPCELCWYQRVFMYPQVILFGGALIFRDRKIFRYIAPLSIVGILLAVYHLYIQWFPARALSGCSLGDVLCTKRQIFYFGFISVPVMSLTGFVGTFLAGWLSKQKPVTL